MKTDIKKRTYELTIAGLKRTLPVVPVSDEISIASFVILGDCELVTACAPVLAARLPEFDYIVTAEAKGIPLVQELSRVLGHSRYIVARKSVKLYMEDPIVSKVVSITTRKEQILCLDREEAGLLRNKRVVIVDDVISTGESLRAMEELLAKCDTRIVAKATLLAEGTASERDDIIFLERLPLFNTATGKEL